MLNYGAKIKQPRSGEGGGTTTVGLLARNSELLHTYKYATVTQCTMLQTTTGHPRVRRNETHRLPYACFASSTADQVSPRRTVTMLSLYLHYFIITNQV